MARRYTAHAPEVVSKRLEETYRRILMIQRKHFMIFIYGFIILSRIKKLMFKKVINYDYLRNADVSFVFLFLNSRFIKKTENKGRE